jgi:di/tricarboxylate transporter
MPMAFASLVGGLVTLVGTSPNIIVSRVRGELTGEPFGMFDFAPVGICIALASLVVLAIAYRLLPGGRKAQAGMEAAFSIAHYTTEALIPGGSELAGKKVADLILLAEGEVTITGVIRDRVRRHHPAPDLVLQAGDAVMLEGPAEDLEALVERAGLRLVGEREEVAAEDAQLVEGVVTGSSPLIGQAPAEADLHGRYGLNLLAVSRRGQRLGQKLARERLRAGDVVILKGEAERVPEALGELRVLPLSERKVALGRGRAGLIPPLVLGVAMLLVGFGFVPVGIAFFGAAVTLLALRTLTMREAYDAMEWPVLFLLAALIPVSESIRTTGGTDLIAGWLEGTISALPPLGALALIMAIAMAVTPFLNNAATVLVMAPIAASLAERLQLAPDGFLMAVAVGAACDFLTPIGHQCNTLVMGPGGYRFGDYWRLGLPLTLTVLAVGVPAIAFFWPVG